MNRLISKRFGITEQTVKVRISEIDEEIERRAIASGLNQQWTNPASGPVLYILREIGWALLRKTLAADARDSLSFYWHDQSAFLKECEADPEKYEEKANLLMAGFFIGCLAGTSDSRKVAGERSGDKRRANADVSWRAEVERLALSIMADGKSRSENKLAGEILKRTSLISTTKSIIKVLENLQLDGKLSLKRDGRSRKKIRNDLFVSETSS